MDEIRKVTQAAVGGFVEGQKSHIELLIKCRDMLQSTYLECNDSGGLWWCRFCTGNIDSGHLLKVVIKHTDDCSLESLLKKLEEVLDG